MGDATRSCTEIQLFLRYPQPLGSGSLKCEPLSLGGWKMGKPENTKFGKIRLRIFHNPSQGLFRENHAAESGVLSESMRYRTR